MTATLLHADTLSNGAIAVLLAATAGETLPTEFRMLENGTTATTKGTITCNAAACSVVLGRVRAARRDGQLPIDYDHGQLNPLGGEKKAAGWFVPAARNGELWATQVQWTPAAAAALRDREYRYFSPALYRDDKGTITDLVNCALTCLPATIGQAPLVLSSYGLAPAVVAPSHELAALCARMNLSASAVAAALAAPADGSGFRPWVDMSLSEALEVQRRAAAERRAALPLGWATAQAPVCQDWSSS